MDEEAGRVGGVERGEGESLVMPGTGLRRATHLRKANKSGYRGVSWYPRYGKWIAQAHLGGVHYNLGYYDDVNDAGVAASDFRLQHKAEMEANQVRRSENASRSLKATLAKVPPEERKERARRGHETLGAKGRSARSRKAAATLTSEQRSEKGRKAAMAMTPEARSERSRKAVKTRMRYEEAAA